jgi:hypothetical protein
MHPTHRLRECLVQYLDLNCGVCEDGLDNIEGRCEAVENGGVVVGEVQGEVGIRLVDCSGKGWMIY